MKNIDNEERANRGGSWFNSSSFCRASLRSGRTPGYRYGNLGFRCGATVTPLK